MEGFVLNDEYGNGDGILEVFTGIMDKGAFKAGSFGTGMESVPKDDIMWHLSVRSYIVNITVEGRAMSSR